MVHRLCGLFAGAFEIVICARYWLDVERAARRRFVAARRRLRERAADIEKHKLCATRRSEEATGCESPCQSNLLTDAEHFAQQHEE
jgi:hypothetical protein